MQHTRVVRVKHMLRFVYVREHIHINHAVLSYLIIIIIIINTNIHVAVFQITFFFIIQVWYKCNE